MSKYQGKSYTDQSLKEQPKQMLERIMRVADLLAKRSQSSSVEKQQSDQKTQTSRSAVQ